MIFGLQMVPLIGVENHNFLKEMEKFAVANNYIDWYALEPRWSFICCISCTNIHMS